jgi:diguanylate cyclase (GGDEF)-like protein/putative nucleotidyltransferase with HDIG domain
MAYKMHILNKIAYFVVFIWTVILWGGLFIVAYDNYSYADVLAKTEALVSVNKDIAHRSWVSSHGGIYVPVSDRTPPNPYLAHIKNRDVNTSDGLRLTLLNPSYVTSQMMREYTGLYGTKAHLTSLTVINPENKPDTWEKNALEAMAITKKEVAEKTLIADEKYFRYIYPLKTKKSCLSCHDPQSYKVDEVSGGISVSIPLKSYYKQASKQSLKSGLVVLLIYIIGLIAILLARLKVREILEVKIKDYEQHLFSLVSMIEKRDSYTAGHTQRVAQYSVMIAEEMGYNEDKVDDIYRASMLHDIGKISTPDSILLKPGDLTKLEYEIIKEHVVSYELLNEVDIYKDIAEIVRHHHEHYDGSGYPEGLKGDEIPILSQIMTVADSFDAMTTNRIYKTRKSVPVALKEMEKLAGEQFHTEVVQAATRVLKDVEVEVTISQRPKTKLEKERFSYFYKDQVTGVYNKEYLEFVLAYNHVDEFNVRCVNIIYMHNFTQYNKKYSWKKGDQLLQSFAKKLDAISAEDLIFRVYGDDFIILNKEHFELESYMTELQKHLEGTDISISYKHVDMNKDRIHSLDDLEKMMKIV